MVVDNVTKPGRPYPEVTAAFVAEFLNEGSLVRLGLLDLSTCVGLRYGRLYLSRLEAFLASLGHQNSAHNAQFYSRFDRSLDA